MGFSFDLGHANLVAYLTSSGGESVPACDHSQLVNLLGSLMGEYGPPPLISDRPDWVVQIQGAAREAFSFLQRSTNYDTQLDPAIAGRTLESLKHMFSRYQLFGLTVRGPGGVDS